MKGEEQQKIFTKGEPCSAAQILGRRQKKGSPSCSRCGVGAEPCSCSLPFLDPYTLQSSHPTEFSFQGVSIIRKKLVIFTLKCNILENFSEKEVEENVFQLEFSTYAKDLGISPLPKYGIYYVDICTQVQKKVMGLLHNDFRISQ